MSASAGGPRHPVRRAAAALAARWPGLVDAYRLVRNPAREQRIRADLAVTRRKARFLRSPLTARPGITGTVLVALSRDDIHDLKTGCLFASALRCEGLDVVVSVPNRRQVRMARYASALGVERVEFQDAIVLSPEEEAEIAAAERAFLGARLDFATVRSWRFRGHDAGRHVLSTLIRITFDGSPDLMVEGNRRALTSILADVLANYVRADRLLGEIDPAVVLVEEAHYATNGPLVDVAVARGTDVIQTALTWRDDAFMSKRLTTETRDVNPRSVAPATLAAFEAGEPWTDVHDAALETDFDLRYGGAWVLGAQYQPATESRTGAQITSELGLDPDRPTAVIFAHVLWDGSLFYGVDLFENYADWLVRTVGAAIANDRVNWIVKAHPSNVFRVAHGDVEGESSEVVLVRDHFPVLPEHVRLLGPETRISTRSLYEFADYGLTVRGTPGIEMPCFSKPVLTAGTGSYAGLGFTYDSETVDEYLDRVAHLHELGPLTAEMTARARRHAYLFFLRRAWIPTAFTNRFDFAHRGWDPLDRNVELCVSSADGFRADETLRAWAGWVIGEDDVDFVVVPRAHVAAGGRVGPHG